MEQFLRYKIKRKIDSGGMATVYLATDTVLHRDVALKMVHPHLLDKPETLRRFENEAHAIATLSHDNIIKIFDFGEENGRRYLVMEFIDGSTLLQLLETHTILPNLVILSLFAQIFSALNAAHEKGICHRDIKPSNIMIDRHGSVRIMDFGIAHLVNQDSMTMTGTFLGSPNYISPEQAQSKRMSVKSDVFSAGAVLYQCATSYLPFDGETPHSIIYSIIHDEPQPVVHHNPKLIAHIPELIEKCMIKDSEIRPSSQECFELIEKFCLSNKFHIGRQRIARFLIDPGEYSRSENRELHEMYSQKARLEFKQRNYVTSLRSFSQSKVFGDLPPEDRKMVSRIGKGIAFRRVAVYLLIGCMTAGMGFLLWPLIQKADLIIENTQKQKLKVEHETVMDDLREEKDTARPAESSHENRRQPPEQKIKTAARPASRETAPPKMEKIDGYFSIYTRPPIAEIYVNDIYRGTSPVGVLSLSPGSHRLKITKKRYKNIDTVITIMPEDTLIEKIPLSKIPAKNHE
ncbi:MAG: protein kinase [Chitinivibrionales bacterium]|nr:protein kinase [Chitinivibrionales bacterium]